MAQNPIGTIADEERLVPLLTEADGFVLDVTDPVETADLPADGTFAWGVHDPGDVPRLVLAALEDGDEAGDLPTAELATDADRRTIAVPERLIANGLGVEPAAYDGDNPLLFEPDEVDDVPVGMTLEGEPGGSVESGVELRPVRFADGTPYDARPLSEVTLDSDPIAEGELARQGEEAAPQSGTTSAPIDGDLLDELLLDADASRSAVVAALEAVARHDLVGEADDAAEGEPIVADDRAVVGLTASDWTAKVAEELDADDATLDAVRAIHARQAETLVERAEVDPDRFSNLVPVVIQPDRHYESDAPPG